MVPPASHNHTLRIGFPTPGRPCPWAGLDGSAGRVFAGQQYNADGSLDLYIQHTSPGPDKEANWLPAPKAQFIPMMRLYWPKETPPSIIDGTWKPPAITEAK